MAETTTELRTPDVMKTAAEWALTQPGWIERVLQAHTERGDVRGRCAGCGTHRLVNWPCALVTIAYRALQIVPGVVLLREAA